MAEGLYRITEDFEKALCDYTGSPYCVTIDNQSNALFLCMMYEGVKGKEITIPERTYPSVPAEVIHAGGKVKFKPVKGTMLTGMYYLEPTNIIDSALHFTHKMYVPKTHMCISFTGFRKFLKSGVKAGAILTDDYEAVAWFKRARFSGRREIDYMKDNFDFIGWNFYLPVEVALRGLMLMGQFYDSEGVPKKNEDLTLPYPKLSDFPCYTNPKEFDRGLKGKK
jgi:hypothetical protein